MSYLSSRVWTVSKFGADICNKLSLTDILKKFNSVDKIRHIWTNVLKNCWAFVESIEIYSNRISSNFACIVALQRNSVANKALISFTEKFRIRLKIFEQILLKIVELLSSRLKLFAKPEANNNICGQLFIQLICCCKLLFEFVSFCCWWIFGVDVAALTARP